MKLGVNTVLFKDFSLREAFRAIANAGYDGVELSAISGMCEHLVLDDCHKSQVHGILALSKQYKLELLSMEAASLDEGRLEKAFAAAQALGMPVVNVGPGGKAGDEQSLLATIETLKARADLAAKYDVTLCVKAHVGNAIYNTETTLRAMGAIDSGSFGIDMDPSHVFRAGEKPEVAFGQVAARVKHVHIRDCPDGGPSPGTPSQQACGRGQIDLYGYMEAMAAAKYDGPVCLEVIGPSLAYADAAIIAAESFGYMNACLKKIGAR
ncbi:MAG: sugar phosphate isomerase/epimerase [Oscillospiraceae bacterium]|nr:sugar phosphate isomerase/epimerase [Oscillospiraceae bacterium]